MQQPAEPVTPLKSGDDMKNPHDQVAGDEDERETAMERCCAEDLGCCVNATNRPPKWADAQWKDLYEIYDAEKHPRRKAALGKALNAHTAFNWRCMFVNIVFTVCVLVIWICFTVLGVSMSQSNRPTCNYHNVPGAVEALRDLRNKLYDLQHNTTAWLEGYEMDN